MNDRWSADPEKLCSHLASNWITTLQLPPVAGSTDMEAWAQAGAYAVIKEEVGKLDVGAVGIIADFANDKCVGKYGAGWSCTVESATNTMVAWLFDQARYRPAPKPISYSEDSIYKQVSRDLFEVICWQVGATPEA